MKSSPGVTRREALTVLIAGGWLLTLHELVGPGASVGGPFDAARGLIGADAAQRIGLLYLAAFPEERSHDLTEQVLRVQGDARTLRDVRDRWSEAVRADFRAGRTVTLAGWQLSRSEARLCAALASAGTTTHRSDGGSGTARAGTRR